jgi:hypothetical protein
MKIRIRLALICCAIGLAASSFVEQMTRSIHRLHGRFRSASGAVIVLVCRVDAPSNDIVVGTVFRAGLRWPFLGDHKRKIPLKVFASS